MILWELLSGTRPLIRKHFQDVPGPSLYPVLPFGLESVVNQALDPNPTQRFQSASEMVEAFAQTMSVRRKTQFTTQERASAAAYDPATGHWQIVPPIITGKVPAVVLSGNPTAITPAQSPTLDIIKTSTPPAKKGEKQIISPITFPDIGQKRDRF